MLWISAGVVTVVLVLLAGAARFFIEPILRKKITSLVVEGSNRLYTCEIGRLDASFLTGNVEIENFEIKVDSNRYRELEARQALPNFTTQVSLQKGYIKDIGVMALLLGKRMTIGEISSEALNMRFSRHAGQVGRSKEKQPLWKAMQPALKSVQIDRVHIDSIRFLYKSFDTATFMKLQFDRFDADFENIRIDSTAAADSSRFLFAKDIFFRFHDLKYRTADSAYKMKAEWITYSSRNKVVEIDSFKLQPTLEKEVFYATTGLRKSLYYVEFDKVRLSNTDLAVFVNEDAFVADSVVLQKPRLKVYLDKMQERVFASKVGSFPHQKLLASKARIKLNHVVIHEGSVLYTEKNDKTRQEGMLRLDKLNAHIRNATNDSTAILAQPRCTVDATALLMGTSPMNVGFTFYLDSANARYDVKGSVKNATAGMLNQLSVPMANIYIPSLQLHELNFFIRADEWTAYTDVQMRYNNLALVLRTIDENGQLKEKGFLNKLINRFAIYSDNPGPDGVERRATNVRFMRLTTQAFFGMIWKSLFAGMQAVMLKSGRVE